MCGGGILRLSPRSTLNTTLKRHTSRPLLWIDSGEDFPPADQAWGDHDPIPGLLVAGGALDAPTLLKAYRHGIFPWFSEDQPILWWSPNPRMVLPTRDFRLHLSLRKEIRSGLKSGRLEMRFDHDFERVITACANTPRKGQRGTWIVPEMINAYRELHQAGYAHSVETWWDGELVGGLYCVCLGHMVYGESMFSHRSNASKIALTALVAFCRAHQIAMIDCQQNTAHLASMGAHEIPRKRFLAHIAQTQTQPTPAWTFQPETWDWVLNHHEPHLPPH